MAVEGGCRCGAVRYRLALKAPPPTYACHCHQCQRWSGSAFSQNAFIPEDLLEVAGPVVVYERTNGEHVSTQRMCGTCHARVYNSNSRRPGILVLRAGTLDRSEELVCVAHIFTDDRQRWFEVPEGVASWPEAPPPTEAAALLGVQADR